MKRKYSICICNYNMGQTIAQSLSSLFPQLDERFEVIIADDGSTDNSLDIIRDFQQRHTNLKLLSLQRDSKRKLGYTRNISIREASGEYVILHLDCDDIYGPYINDFTKVFHKIEAQINKDILLCGQHIFMIRRDFLLSHGSYANIYRGEDRHLMLRMAAIDALVILNHVNFITRLPRKKTRSIPKGIFDTFDHMRNIFRLGLPLSKALAREIKNKYSNKKHVWFFRLAMLPISWVFSIFDEPLSKPDNMIYPEGFAAYCKKANGTFAEIMSHYGGTPDLSFLSPDAQRIFSQSAK